MRTKTFYLVLCLVGTVWPYWQFVTWLSQHGFDSTLFFRNLFANRISTFFASDVLISAIALITFVRVESTRLRIRWRWLQVLATLLVGRIAGTAAVPAHARVTVGALQRCVAKERPALPTV